MRAKVATVIDKYINILFICITIRVINYHNYIINKSPLSL